jgi:DNA invertase Pin-like site-specific DNA recombinase
MIRAVVYYRMSTDRQDKSIPTQRIEVEKYVAKCGYTILHEYRDEGISGGRAINQVCGGFGIDQAALWPCAVGST